MVSSPELSIKKNQFHFYEAVVGRGPIKVSPKYFKNFLGLPTHEHVVAFCETHDFVPVYDPKENVYKVSK